MKVFESNYTVYIYITECTWGPTLTCPVKIQHVLAFLHLVEGTILRTPHTVIEGKSCHSFQNFLRKSLYKSIPTRTFLSSVRGIMTAASTVVVVINLVLQWVPWTRTRTMTGSALLKVIRLLLVTGTMGKTRIFSIFQ